MKAPLRISRFLCLSLIAIGLPSTRAEPAARPFPQHTVYAAGTARPTNLTAGDLDRETADFYDQWKRHRLVPAKSSGELYVAFEGSDKKSDRNVVSVSEGHGYGMIITAMMAGHDADAQNCFNGLYRFFKSHPSKNNPHLMSWCQDHHDSKRQDSATDGDLDIAYSLLLADRQWGSQGEVNYLEAAKRMIDAILESDINREIWSVKLGDAVTPDDSEYADTRSSDLMPGHFRAFARATGRPEWNTIVEKSYKIMESVQAAHSPETGLLPDFICHINTTPVPARAKYLESKHDGSYSYNACRLPFRVALDFLITGEPRSRAVLGKINRWARQKTGEDPTKIGAGYTLSGKEIDHDSQMCFVAPLAVAAMVDPENQAWLNGLDSYVINSARDATGYYDSTIKLLCLIALSGNWWSP
jgi:endo-1,4-beta-D-glucanase Y